LDFNLLLTTKIAPALFLMAWFIAALLSIAPFRLAA
jgi:hypothetical protein